MGVEVPPLAEFLRWLQRTPEAFVPPLSDQKGSVAPEVRLPAVVADLYESYFRSRADDAFTQAFAEHDASENERNRRAWVLIACHLLWHPMLRAIGIRRDAFRKFFLQELPALAAAAPVDQVLEDEERREELVRRALRACELQLPGESDRDAEDRLAQVDSIERLRLLREASHKERRAREIREEMARKAAEEAAAKVSRE